MEETVYIELHKARELFKINEECMNMIRKLAVNPLLKADLLSQMNKLKQYLLLQNLRVERERDTASDTARSGKTGEQVG